MVIQTSRGAPMATHGNSFILSSPVLSLHFLRACSLTPKLPCNLKTQRRPHGSSYHQKPPLAGRRRRRGLGAGAAQRDRPLLAGARTAFCSRCSSLDTPPTAPAAGELAVGLTGDMYYMLPGEPEELDDTPAEQLLEFLMMPVPDEQDSVADTAGPRDAKGNGDAISPLLGELQE